MLFRSSVAGKRSAKEALAELENSPGEYSCIVTDIRMPVIDGHALIDLVRKNPKLEHIPIIALTAYGTVDCLIECLKAGASGFLVKPPKKDDLARELGRAYRIVRHHASPRLASTDEVELIRNILIERGWV